MLLFIVVAIGLYVLYTKPSIVPGRRARGSDAPVSYTAIPGNPIASELTGKPTAAEVQGDRPAASRNAATGSTMAAERTTAAEGTTAGKNDDAVTEGGA